MNENVEIRLERRSEEKTSHLNAGKSEKLCCVLRLAFGRGELE
jgi:hypothetical protein